MSGVFPDMDAGTRNDIAMKFGDIASRAGQVIMAIYENGPSIAQKADGSPVTEADVRAEHLIRDELSRLLPGIDIVAEEWFEPRQGIQVPVQFLLVDPLDGTREFISRNGEFTVNIALIEGGVPIVGCVYAPARARMYVAGVTAFLAELRPGERMPFWLSSSAHRHQGLPAGRIDGGGKSLSPLIPKPRRSSRACRSRHARMRAPRSSSAPLRKATPTCTRGLRPRWNGIRRLARRCSLRPAGAWSEPTASRCAMASQGPAFAMMALSHGARRH